MLETLLKLIGLVTVTVHSAEQCRCEKLVWHLQYRPPVSFLRIYQMKQ